MNEKNHILLGNGFNTALQNPSLTLELDYSSIKNRMYGSLQPKEAVNLLDKYPSCDIEKIIEMEKNDGGDAVLIDLIKKSFIESILSGQEKALPFTYNNELNVEKNCAAENLRGFDNIFTLNYDLMLFWLIVSENLVDKFKDGFCGKCHSEKGLCCEIQEFQDIPDKNLFYLHGALHLLKYNNKSAKIKKLGPLNSINIRKALLESYKSLNNLLVVESNYSSKIDYIKDNPYLKCCYENFIKMDGGLVVYGCSMIEHLENLKDYHLIQAVYESKISNLYLGFYDVNLYNDAEYLRKLSSIITRDGVKNVNVFKFNSREINIWVDNDFLNKVIDMSVNVNAH